MLANYQMLPEGGQGWLRLIELLPDGETIQVKTYSPVLTSTTRTRNTSFSW